LILRLYYRSKWERKQSRRKLPDWNKKKGLNLKNRRNLAILVGEIRKVGGVGRIIAYQCSPRNL
jgi:hypothetical protein